MLRKIKEIIIIVLLIVVFMVLFSGGCIKKVYSPAPLLLVSTPYDYKVYSKKFKKDKELFIFFYKDG